MRLPGDDMFFSCSGCDLVVQAHTEQLVETEGGGLTPVDADGFYKRKGRFFSSELAEIFEAKIKRETLGFNLSVCS